MFTKEHKRHIWLKKLIKAFYSKKSKHGFITIPYTLKLTVQEFEFVISSLKSIDCQFKNYGDYALIKFYD